jgi:hypothetical protein
MNEAGYMICPLEHVYLNWERHNFAVTWSCKILKKSLKNKKISQK